MKHKSYIFDFRARRIVILTAGEPERAVSFATLTTYERTMVGRLQASLHKMNFKLVGCTDNGGWIYEGVAA